MDSAFTTAVAPPSFRCLRLTLVPLTVGHLFLLREQCPEVLEAEEYDLGPLALAAFCCSMSHLEAVRSINARWSTLLFKWWGKRCGTVDFHVERRAFNSYLEASLSLPDIWKNPEKPLKELGAPLEFRLLAFLMSELHCTEPEALLMTTLRANSLWATIGDMRGAFELTTDSRQAFFDYARAQDELAAKAQQN